MYSRQGHKHSILPPLSLLCFEILHSVSLFGDTKLWAVIWLRSLTALVSSPAQAHWCPFQ